MCEGLLQGTEKDRAGEVRCKGWERLRASGSVAMGGRGAVRYVAMGRQGTVERGVLHWLGLVKSGRLHWDGEDQRSEAWCVALEGVEPGWFVALTGTGRDGFVALAGPDGDRSELVCCNGLGRAPQAKPRGPIDYAASIVVLPLSGLSSPTTQRTFVRRSSLVILNLP